MKVRITASVVVLVDDIEHYGDDPDTMEMIVACPHTKIHVEETEEEHDEDWRTPA